MMNKGLAQYQDINTHSNIESASPHRLIQMLMDGMMQRLAEAKGSIQRRAIADKGEAIGKAISIVSGLRASLNPEVGGDIASNLEQLYLYMERRLLEANRDNSAEMIDEVMGLMKTIKSGWDGIAQHAA